MLAIGFTGTRHGMSEEQRDAVDSIVAELDGEVGAHQGCCVGADEEFARISDVRGCSVIGHPPSRSEFLSVPALELCHEIKQPLDYMARNRAIVSASNIMIAAPFEPTPQLRGGTWATIRMALRALRAGKLRDLYVVWRDGKLMDHSGWRAS